MGFVSCAHHDHWQISPPFALNTGSGCPCQWALPEACHCHCLCGTMGGPQGAGSAELALSPVDPGPARGPAFKVAASGPRELGERPATVPSLSTEYPLSSWEGPREGPEGGARGHMAQCPLRTMGTELPILHPRMRRRAPRIPGLSRAHWPARCFCRVQLSFKRLCHSLNHRAGQERPVEPPGGLRSRGVLGTSVRGLGKTNVRADEPSLRTSHTS